MTNFQLSKVLSSLSSIHDRLQKVDDKFAENEDYSFECDYDGDTLRDLIRVALDALDTIYESTEENPYLLNYVERD